MSIGGVLLPDAAREKPIAGQVVSVGPGKREKDGTRKTPQVGPLKLVLGAQRVNCVSNMEVELLTANQQSFQVVRKMAVTA